MKKYEATKSHQHNDQHTGPPFDQQIDQYPITMYQQMRHSWVKYIIWQKENLFLFVRIAERDVKHRKPNSQYQDLEEITISENRTSIR